MQNRTLLIAVVVLAVLGGYVYWSEQQPVEATLEEHEIELLPDADVDGVERLTLTSPKAELALLRTEDGDWVVDGDPPRRAVNELCDAAARAAVGVISIRRLGDVGTGEGLGLEDGLRVSVELTGRNQPFVFTLGGAPPIGDGRYLKITGEPDVHLVQGGATTPLNSDPLSFRDRRLVPIDADEVAHVSIVPRAPGEPFSMRRDGRHWFLEGEPPYRVETNKARDLVHSIVELEAESFQADAPTADRVDLHILLTDADGVTAEIAFAASSVGGARDAVARGTLLGEFGADQPARVRPDFLVDFDADPMTWRSMELLDFNPWLVTEIDWSVAGQAWELRKGDDGWERVTDAGRTELDSDAVHDLLSELDGLRAVDYAAPELDPTVAGVEEARVELRQGEDLSVAITLFRGGNEDYVTVEGEPGLRIVGADVHETMGNLRPLDAATP